MSEAIEPSLRRKLWMTPWRDLLRGRLTLGLDVAAQIQSADIAENARALISAVVRRTRLWRSEKVAVAEELIAHFRDGLDSGESINQLIEKFGDERRSAKLIRRAKVRNRPMAWRATGVVVRFIEIVLAVQFILAAYFFAGHPSPKVDYMAQLNQPVLAIPEDQRAWPLYRQAIIKSSDYHPPVFNNFYSIDDFQPGGKGWPWMTQWLRQHAAALELAREAAAKPALGFVYGSHGSCDDPAVFPELVSPSREDFPVLLPYLNKLRSLSEVLTKDADLARQEDDVPRFSSDVAAILGMSGQLRSGGFIICSLVADALRWDALKQISDVLTAQSAWLRNSDLQDLAHQLSRIGDAAETYGLEGMRLSIYDRVQNTYTDDGNGDGRLTPQGIWPDSTWDGIVFVRNNAQMFTFGPAVMELAASRREIVNRFDQWARLVDSDLHHSMRERERTSADDFLISTNDSDRWHTRDHVLDELVPGLQGWRIQAEWILGARDGIEAGLAAEMYRRRHGQFPASLQQMVPELLPVVPADRITGDPVKYRLVNGQPIVYSVGVDRKDDGGRPPEGPGGKMTNWPAAAAWPDPTDRKPHKIPSGDWILYPLPNYDD
jgi:hypothetical protein